ncbi:DUF3422 family protein [Halodurantibacterium flavum]|uniref:DUF3422 family protein n=1 Tax=Halodurantibacterium flavum TaxID=1382802 RepID=A0ABW4S9Y4_9RHOB
MAQIDDHPLRYALANELHARPFPALRAPCEAVFLAVKEPQDAAGRDRARDRAHLTDLLDRHAAAHPAPDATHYFGDIGRHSLKWENHTEFVTYTAFAQGLSPRPFDPAGFDVFPADWLAAAPGSRVTSILIRVDFMPEDEAGIARKLADWFVPESLAAARVIDGAAIIAADFRIDPAGHMRMAIFVRPDCGERRVGRIVQRLCEIETYKSMSMLGLARARALAPRMGALDVRLSGLVADMSGDNRSAEDTLNDLLAISSELETLLVHSSFRFGATAAYEALVNQRIAVLREERHRGGQTFAEFMMRRFDPAMRTVKAAEARLNLLAERAVRAAELLRTRVDVERSAQNQKVLASMDRRADLQLRLQHTVEGLSVVAISYYALGIAGYLIYPLTVALGIAKEVTIAALVPPVVLGVWLGLRHVRRRLH